MIAKATLRSFLALAGSSLLAVSSSHAATYYWDDNSNGANFGTAGANTGTWAAPTAGPTAGWSLSSAGANAFAGFTTGTTDTLNFGNGATGLGAGTITVGTVDAGNMTFASGSGAIVLSGGAINLAASTTITVDNATDTINSVLSGASTSLIKAGSVSGTLILGGDNTYTGSTIVNAGNLSITHNNALGTTAGTTTINGSNGTTGGSLILSNATTGLTVAEAFNFAASAAGRVNIVNDSAQNHILSGAIDITSSGRVTFSTSAGGSITITNTVSGNITNGNDLYLRGDSTQYSNSGIAGTGKITGNITYTGDGRLIKTDDSTWTLSGTNTYTGDTVVAAGTLIAGANAPSGSDGAFGNATSEILFGQASGNFAASILTDGAFTIGRIIRNATTNSSDAGTRVLTLGGTTADNSVFSGNIFLGTTNQTSKGIRLTAAAGGQVTFSGVIQNPTGQDVTETSSAAALTAVTKVGAGTVILSGTNTYTGKTAVNLGTLLTTKAAALPGYNVASKVSVLSGATLAVNVDSGGWTSGEIDTLLGATTAAFASGSNLGIEVTTGSFTYANNVGATQTAKGLVKSGAGTLILSGANTYSGTTTVSAGTLLVNGTHITSTAGSGYTVSNSGSTLGGTGRLAVNGGISVASTATLAPGASIGTLTLDGANVTGNVLTMATGSLFSFELDGSGGTPDQLALWNYASGDVVLNDNAINLSLLGAQAAGTYNVDIFRFFSNAGTTATTHAFLSGLTIGTLGTGIDSASIDWNGTADNSQSIALTYTVIPEPKTAILGAIGVLILLRRCRH
jgi:fibronectin-binding autotransporter adhesin